MHRPTSQLRFSSVFETPGKRDQEAFLYQYDPLEVLGLPPTTTSKKQVDAAFETLKAAYGEGGKMPNKNKMQRFQSAYDILLDPHSVYYTKATIDQKSRRELMVDVMPFREAFVVKSQAWMIMIVVVLGFFTFVYSTFFPTIKMARAASRGMGKA
jgi:hypothetical protein